MRPITQNLDSGQICLLSCGLASIFQIRKPDCLVPLNCRIVGTSRRDLDVADERQHPEGVCGRRTGERSSDSTPAEDDHAYRNAICLHGSLLLRLGVSVSVLSI
jgi:hypothetical protein